MLEWITANTSAFASLMSAVVAASAALVVFALTQYLWRKRERTQFLTPKLEALYLLINEVSENNVKFFKLIVRCLEGDSEARLQLEAMDELDLYDHRLAKQIIMYTRLYFPRLSLIHQHLFDAQRGLSQLMFDLHSEKPPEISAVVEASGRVAHLLRLMEEEIIKNRDCLLVDHFFPKKYKETSILALEEANSAPDGPIMNPPRK